MIISIFEKNEFHNWCKNNINEHKKSILLRATNLLISVMNNKRTIKRLAVGEIILFENLDCIEIFFNKFEEDSTTIYNTCLVDRCVSFIYDELKLEEICKEQGIKFKDVQDFLQALSKYVTDAAIVEWKMLNRFSLHSVPIISARASATGFFPISYELKELISIVERKVGKKIEFAPGSKSNAIINKKTICCFFDVDDRVQSEYKLAYQLLEIYLYYNKFELVNKECFIDEDNWDISIESFKKALNIILQNKLINMLIDEQYNIYNNSSLCNMLNFKCNEDYVSSTFQYLCYYFTKTNNCPGCKSMTDLIEDKSTCPIVNKLLFSEMEFNIEQLDSSQKHDSIIHDIINSLNLK